MGSHSYETHKAGMGICQDGANRGELVTLHTNGIVEKKHRQEIINLSIEGLKNSSGALTAGSLPKAVTILGSRGETRTFNILKIDGRYSRAFDTVSMEISAIEVEEPEPPKNHQPTEIVGVESIGESMGGVFG